MIPLHQKVVVALRAILLKWPFSKPKKIYLALTIPHRGHVSRCLDSKDCKSEPCILIHLIAVYLYEYYSTENFHFWKSLTWKWSKQDGRGRHKIFILVENCTKTYFQLRVNSYYTESQKDEYLRYTGYKTCNFYVGSGGGGKKWRCTQKDR